MPWSTKQYPKTKQLAADDVGDFTSEYLANIQEIFETAKSSGWPLYRQGGSTRTWITPGTNNYTSHGFTQVGAVEWSGGSATSGSVVVTLPRKYSGRPLVWVSLIDTDADNVNTNVAVSGINTTDFTLRWWSTSGVTAVRVAWLAMGPGKGE